MRKSPRRTILPDSKPLIEWLKYLALLLFLPGMFSARSFAADVNPPILSKSISMTPASGDIVIQKDKTSESDVISVGHSVFVEGHVKGSVAALSGSVVIQGQVDSDVVALGGDVWMEPGAVVGGDLVVLGGRLFHSNVEQIKGKTLATTYFREELRRAFVTRGRTLLSTMTDRTALLWRAARILAWFIIAVLVILFVPVQTAFAMDRFERDFARIAVIGFLSLIVFIGLLTLFSLMIKIIVGIPLMFLLLVSLFAMWGFGAVAFYLTIGRLIVRWIFKRPLPLALYAILGLVGWSLLSFVPYLNLFIPYLVFIFALGISVATKLGTGKPWFVKTA